MAQCAALTTISDGNTATAVTVMANENLVRSAYNAHDIATGDVHGIVAPDTLVGKAITDVMKLQDVPIGSIIPFYDFNGGLTFNATYWAYCNGQTIAVGALGAQTLPDLSNRYLVGFGTEDGADIGSAAWSTEVVGKASHQIDIAHTHPGPSHNHASLVWLSGGGWSYYNSSGVLTADSSVNYYYGGYGSGSAKAMYHSGTTSKTYYTSNAGTGNTGSGGSATQDIQPRSISVRFIMRIL